ncbi:hypothetical protein GCM10007079_44110 [Nocardiopsis terrae]|nr:hypothetical protein GCM10007079_44110 [Nocardiopsis terrae]
MVQGMESSRVKSLTVRDRPRPNMMMPRAIGRPIVVRAESMGHLGGRAAGGGADGRAGADRVRCTVPTWGWPRRPERIPAGFREAHGIAPFRDLRHSYP